MKTLYDLLGALPDDDADEIRSAFRKAVKSTHPDIKPGDPEAALKFRQIVRANEILGDSEQRAAYDHLLALACEEQRQEAKQATAARMHKVASSVMALAGTSAAAVGGYLLFMHMSAASVSALAPIMAATDGIKFDLTKIDSADAKPVETAAVTPDVAVASPEPAPSMPVETVGSATPETPATPSASIDNVAASDSEHEATGTLPSNPPANDAKFYHDRGMASYHKGDLMAAIADLDQAIQIDPRFQDAYIDRGIVFYRLRKFDRAFTDVAAAKRIEKSNRAVLNAMAKKQPLRPLKLDPPKMTRVSQRHTSGVAD
jgi:tetratricopeptide (TPR) repeat protein